MAQLILDEGAAPSTPAAGKVTFYAKTDGLMYSKDDAGVETAFTSVALAADQTWSGSQRGTITTDNDGSFDLNASNNFFCTPTGAVAVTFTNHVSGQIGTVLFVNSSNYAITAAATTFISAADLSKLSTTGTYILTYLDNGTNAYCSVTAKLTSAGA